VPHNYVRIRPRISSLSRWLLDPRRFTCVRTS
jgi:hypothetical protein